MTYLGPIATLEQTQAKEQQTEAEATSLVHQLIVLERAYEEVEAQRDAALERAAELESPPWTGFPMTDGPGPEDRERMEAAGVVEVIGSYGGSE